jgi:hypothetical protein
MSCLLDLVLPTPLVEGMVVQELDKFAVGVLRQLAFESRFAGTLWQWSEMAERLEAKGVPGNTRAALQGFLEAPLPEQLAGLTSWCALLPVCVVSCVSCVSCRGVSRVGHYRGEVEPQDARF